MKHAMLAALAAEWEVRLCVWPESAGEPLESEVLATNHTVLGGRILELRSTGDALGDPFEARGYLGYNHLAEEFQFVWLGSATTMLEVRRGTLSGQRIDL